MPGMRSITFMFSSLFTRALLACLACCAAAAPQAAVVEQLRVHAAPDHVRFVFDLSGPVDWNQLTLEGPDRIVLDFDDSSLGFDPALLDLDGTGVRSVRSGRRGGDLRVVLDVDRRFDPKPFALAPVAPTVIDSCSICSRSGEPALRRPLPRPLRRMSAVM